MIWNEEIECMDPASLKELQGRRLVSMVRDIYERNPVYHKKLDEAGISPGDVKGIDDLPKLPFTV